MYMLRHTAVARAFKAVPKVDAAALKATSSKEQLHADEFERIRARVFAHIDVPNAFGDDMLLTQEKKGKGPFSEL